MNVTQIILCLQLKSHSYVLKSGTQYRAVYYAAVRYNTLLELIGYIFNECIIAHTQEQHS